MLNKKCVTRCFNSAVLTAFFSAPDHIWHGSFFSISANKKTFKRIESNYTLEFTHFYLFPIDYRPGNRAIINCKETNN